MGQVSDSADAGKEISYASASASEHQGYEAPSGTKVDALRKPAESPKADDADKIMDQECTNDEINNVKVEEKIESKSETQQHETVEETTDDIKLINKVGR